MSNHHLFDHVHLLVYSGFYSKKDIFIRVALMGREVGEDAEAVEAKLRGYAANQLAAHEAEERTWTERTHNDQLDAAFAAMNRAGLVARQNAGWTQTMGWEDCWQAYRERKERGQEARGAVFYHEQDMERGIAGDGLYLAFGVFAEEDDQFPEQNAAIAREVCTILTQHGIAYTWDGDPSTRIRVLPFPWRRRRHTKAPSMPPPAHGDARWRRFQHANGRRWEARASGRTVELRMVDEDGDVLERNRTLRDASEAEQTVQQLIDEQIAEGFVESVPPQAE